MSYVVGQPYLVLSVDDYNFLVEELGVGALSDFSSYTDPTTGTTYYLALQSAVDANEMAAFAGAEFYDYMFGTAYFTNSVQANITMP